MPFQGREHLHQGQVHLLVEPLELVIGEGRPQLVAELQREIRILGGVLHGVVEVGLVEALLGLALPHHLLEGDGFHVQQAHGEVVQVVADAALQQEAQDHAVVGQAEHRQAMTGQHLEVVLEVLAALANGGIRQQRRQDAPDLRKGKVPGIQVERQLREKGSRLASQVQQPLGQAAVRQQSGQGTFSIGRGRLQVGQRHIESLVRCPGQTQSHEVPPGGVDAGGLRIQAEAARGAAGGYGRLEIGQGGGKSVLPLAASSLGALREFLGEGLEAQGLERLAGLGLVHAGISQVLRMQGQFQVRHHGDQALREVQPLGRGLQAFALLGLQLGLGRDHAIQGVELLQQQGGALLADAGHPLHVVRGIPHQAEEVHHLLGPHAHAGLHALAVVPHLAVLGVEHLDAELIVDQLQQVLVRADDDRRKAHGRRFSGQGAHDVVGLVAVQLHDGDVQGLHQLADHGDLRAQVLGHGIPVGLVFRIDLVPERGLRRIEDAGDVRRLVLLQQLQHQPRERIGRPVLQPRIGEVASKNEGEGVDQIKAILSHRPPPCSTARSRVSAQPIPRE